MSLHRTPKGGRAPGIPLAIARGAPWDGQVVSLTEDDDSGQPGFEAPDHSVFEVLPEVREGKRDVIVITGQSGAGKTSFACEYINNFVRTFGTKSKPPPVLYIIREDPADDPVVRKAGFKYLHVDPRELAEEDPITLDDIIEVGKGGPVLIVFDDCKMSKKDPSGKPSAEYLAFHDLVSGVLERGRKKRIYVLYIVHKIADGQDTSTLLREKTAVWFPCRSTDLNLGYYQSKYLGINGDARKLFKANSRLFGRGILLRTEDVNPWIMVSSKYVGAFDLDEVEVLCKAQKLLTRSKAEAAVAKQLGAPTLPASHKASTRTQLRRLATQATQARREERDDDSSTGSEDA